MHDSLKSTAVQQALDSVILFNIIVIFGCYLHVCVGFFQGLWFPPTSQRCAIKWLACLLRCRSLSEGPWDGGKSFLSKVGPTLHPELPREVRAPPLPGP